MLEVFIQALVLYFVVIDPIGITPIFMSITQRQNEREKNKTAIESVFIATIILILFSIIGQFIFSYLNVSLESFRIAGGIILFLISLEMLFNKRQERKEQIIDKTKNELSIFPLAIPILAGPAAITSTIVIATNNQGEIISQIISLLGLILVMLITLIFFYYYLNLINFLIKT